MKKIYFIILIISFYSSPFAQKEYINCIVMIDGKLTSTDLQGYIEYVDTMQQMQTIKIDCHTPGVLGFSTEDMLTIQNLPEMQAITIHFDFTEFIYKKRFKKNVYHYSYSFKIWDLLKRCYIVFSITNLNKKKRIYYFDYAIDNMQKGCRKEWRKGFKKKHQIFYN